MKYAAAMKYGGELVDAADCDYSDFTALVPLCPECKEVVHLRKGGERLSAKGKSYKFGACWAHTKGRDAEHVAGCEMRVNGYSAEDREEIAAKAKGQRLRRIQRWFRKIVSENPLIQGSYRIARKYKKYILQKEVSTDFFTTVLLDLLKNESQLESTLRLAWKEIIKSLATDHLDTELKMTATEVATCLSALKSFSKIDVSLHFKITRECLSFLVAFKQKWVFEEMLCLAWVRRKRFEDTPNYSRGPDSRENPFLLYELIANILSCNWEAELQKRSA